MTVEKLTLIAAISLMITACNRPSKNIFDNGKWVDLSYAYDSQTPFWPTANDFDLDTVFAGMTEGGYYYSAYQFTTAEHGGTHIDAPIHFAAGKKTVDQIGLDQLMGNAVVIDVTDSVNAYVDYRVNIEDFKKWEAKHGRIEDGSIILLRTGFGNFWPDKLKYLGTDQKGQAAVAMLHFPGLHEKAAQWLVDNRNIKAIGLDTPSIDYGRSSDFKSHRILMEQNIPAFENVGYLDQLPENGAYIIALPMKIRGGSGGPLRIVAYVPN